MHAPDSRCKMLPSSCQERNLPTRQQQASSRRLCHQTVPPPRARKTLAGRHFICSLSDQAPDLSRCSALPWLMCMSAGARGIYGARQEVLVRQTEGLDFELSDLQNCSVHLQGCMGALRIRGLRRCLVYAGPITGATFLEGVGLPNRIVPVASSWVPTVAIAGMITISPAGIVA